MDEVHMASMEAGRLGPGWASIAKQGEYCCKEELAARQGVLASTGILTHDSVPWNIPEGNPEG